MIQREQNGSKVWQHFRSLINIRFLLYTYKAKVSQNLGSKNQVYGSIVTNVI